MGFDGVTLSLHRDYMEYENFVRQNKEFGYFVVEANYVIVDFVGCVAKTYSNIWQKTEEADQTRSPLEKRFSTLVLPI